MRTSTCRWNRLGAGRGAAFIGLTICMLQSGGCQRGQYDLDLSADGSVLHREIRYRQAHGENETPPPVETEEARLLTAVYGVDVPSAASSELVLKGESTGATPQDIGGAGSLQHWHTPLGDAWVYAERFRGDDRPSATLKLRTAAADELVDLIRDWFQVELKGSADRDRVDRFLNNDFREDVRNLTTLVWTAGAVSEARGRGADGEFVMRVGLYLVEHGYMTHRDLPRLHSLNDEEMQFSFVRALLARRIGVDLSERDWNFLESRSAAERSLNAAIGLREIEASENVSGGPVPASTFAADRLMRALGSPLASGDGLTARLHLPEPPLRTNGDWQADEKCVVWQRSLPLRDATTSPALPAVMYAEWTSADAAFQQEHFGRTVLDGEALIEYCVWSARLNDEQRAAFDKFLATLTPGTGLANQVQQFVFPPPKDWPPTVARPPEMLVEALQAK